MIQLQFPGKLFLLGEFFAMEAGQSSVVCAVDRYLTISIEKSEALSLESDYGNLNNHNLYKAKPKMALAAEAVRFTYDYLDYLGIEKQMLEMKIESDLLYEGKKIGLGSSAVVIVAIIAGILKAHDYAYEKETLFKLAVLCQKRLGKMSSGGDIAAAVYGSCIAYRRYDPAFLEGSEEFELIDKPWPLLEIRPLAFLEDVHMAVYWTQKENDTDDSLAYFKRFKKNYPEKYEEMRKQAENICRRFVDTEDLSCIFDYRQLLLELEKDMGKQIEIQEHRQFIDKVQSPSVVSQGSSVGTQCPGFLLGLVA